MFIYLITYLLIVFLIILKSFFFYIKYPQKKINNILFQNSIFFFLNKGLINLLIFFINFIILIVIFNYENTIVFCQDESLDFELLKIEVQKQITKTYHISENKCGYIYLSNYYKIEVQNYDKVFTGTIKNIDMILANKAKLNSKLEIFSNTNSNHREFLWTIKKDLDFQNEKLSSFIANSYKNIMNSFNNNNESTKKTIFLNNINNINDTKFNSIFNKLINFKTNGNHDINNNIRSYITGANFNEFHYKIVKLLNILNDNNKTLIRYQNLSDYCDSRRILTINQDKPFIRYYNPFSPEIESQYNTILKNHNDINSKLNFKINKIFKEELVKKGFLIDKKPISFHPFEICLFKESSFDKNNIKIYNQTLKERNSLMSKHLGI